MDEARRVVARMAKLHGFEATEAMVVDTAKELAKGDIEKRSEAAQATVDQIMAENMPKATTRRGLRTADYQNEARWQGLFEAAEMVVREAAMVEYVTSIKRELTCLRKELELLVPRRDVKGPRSAPTPSAARDPIAALWNWNARFSAAFVLHVRTDLAPDSALPETEALAAEAERVAQALGASPAPAPVADSSGPAREEKSE